MFETSNATFFLEKKELKMSFFPWAFINPCLGHDVYFKNRVVADFGSGKSEILPNFQPDLADASAATAYAVYIRQKLTHLTYQVLFAILISVTCGATITVKYIEEFSIDVIGQALC